MTITTAKWTVDDYHRMVEAGILDDRHVELLNGAIIEMPPEGTSHANRSTKGANYLRQLLGDRVEIREGKPLTLSDQSEPEPDIAVVQPLDDEYDAHHPYPENIFWLIEFSNSSLEKDLEVKRRVYATSNYREISFLIKVGAGR
ncbi:Uma2 family endonuclease [Egbenema bharatensis]|uniref:Uma2 family endonuclease n=1 Tax=Egbenema bharatensis TaxID=3463334 RepID=UPI003A86C2C0